MNIRTVCLATLLAFASPLVAIAGDKEESARQAALAWLTLVDTKQYAQSWDATALLFRGQVNRADWVKAVAAARKPFGDLISRKLISATYATSLPGAPDGEYVVLQFATVFTNKAQAVETITPMLDEGRWRVSGYFVR